MNKALIFILITVSIDAIGLGIIMPIVPDLITELTNLPLNEAAIHGGRLTFVYAIMQFIFMPILGGLSDAYGRRKVMLLSLLCLSVDYLLMGLAPTITLLYLGRLISGAAGATYSTANAYITDITPTETRAQSFGLIGAAFGVGFILGPALGGLLGEMGPRIPFYAAALVSLCNVIFGFFFFPESLVPEKRRPFSWRRANPFGTFKSVLKLPQLSAFLTVMFLFSFAHFAYPSVWAFFTKQSLGWSPKEVGLSLAIFGLFSAFVQGYLIRIALDKFTLNQCAVFGTLMNAVSLIGISFAQSTLQIYLWLIPAALAGLAGPAIQKMMTIRVSETAQGELQGAIGAIGSLAMLISPVLLTTLFKTYAADTAQPHFPGAPFFFAGLLILLALFILITAVRDSPRDQSEQVLGQKKSLSKERD